MPVRPTYPGVYVEEIPSGVRTITGVATSITAFVGYTAKGPLNKAMRVLNQGDYDRIFGGLHPDSEVSYAVSQFFLNGGTEAYVVRVAKNIETARVAASATVGGAKVLYLNAADPGGWGNLLRVDVDYATRNPDSLFNLTVTRYESQNGALVPTASEQHRNLSMNRKSATYVENVVNADSKLLKATRNSAITFADRGFSFGSAKVDGSLGNIPDDSVISVVLNGVERFDLLLPPALVQNVNTVPGGSSKPAELVTALKAAIANAGKTGRITAERAKVDTTTDATNGEFVKLVSVAVGGDPTTNDEFSSVEVVAAAVADPTKDAAKRLKLGFANGGREKEGASSRRPAPTGTQSADLWGKLLTPTTIAAGTLNFTVTDLATSTQVDTGTVTLASGVPLQDFPRALQQGLQASQKRGTATAIAEIPKHAAFLRVDLNNPSMPSLGITFTGQPATDTGLAAPTTVAVEEYALGATATAYGAQSDGLSGADGAPGGATEIIGDYNSKSGIYALRDVDLFNMLVIPETTRLSDTEAKNVIDKATAYCVERRAFYLIDPDPAKRAPDDIAAWVDTLNASKNSAIFYPRVQIPDPLANSQLREMAASGTVAGVMARTDGERGVWKAAAGTDAVLRGVQALSYTLTDGENGVLNPKAINCLRAFPVYGRVLWGARTLEGNDERGSEWKYIPVRRLALFLEESLFRGSKWVVFEPNDEPLWAQIRLNFGAFMHNLFRQGAFQGKTPRDAYFVKCDAETTTQNDRNLGIVNILVGFAPLKPAEFVIIKLQQMAGQIET